VCTGVLEGEQLVCPWHGFRYDVTTGTLIEDPSAVLETYPVSVRDGRVYVTLPDEEHDEPLPSLDGPVTVSIPSSLAPDQFVLADLPPGGMRLVKVDEEDVVVYNVGGTLYATQDACSHTGGPLSEGELEGTTIACPVHGSRFDVTTGAVCRGPAKQPLRTYRIVVNGGVGRVTA
jgi:3-phenylpropionate/trans-cinnamate dioxygenase ferredoxin subunit